jgi:hypothetical protein
LPSLLQQLAVTLGGKLHVRLAGSLGRFTSADDFLNDTTARGPGSWNLYVYARNNPLRYVNPHGEKIFLGELSTDAVQELLRRINATYRYHSCVF